MAFKILEYELQRLKDFDSFRSLTGHDKYKMEELEKALSICSSCEKLPTEEQINIEASNKAIKYNFIKRSNNTRAKRMFKEAVDWYKTMNEVKR